MRQRDHYGSDLVGGTIEVNLTNWLPEDLLPMDIRAKLLVESSEVVDVTIGIIKSQMQYRRRSLK